MSQTGTGPTSTASPALNRRQHDRIRIRDVGRFVEERSGRALAVGDLGYSGMFLLERPPGAELPGGEIRGTLEVLDVATPAAGHVVRSSAGGLGVMFDHSQGALLDTLRLFLDPARYGTTMVAMNKAYVAEPFRGPECLVFQGLGPTTLTVRFDSGAHATVEAFSLTIRSAGYHVVEYQGGKVLTGVMREGGGSYEAKVFDPSVAEHRVAVRRAASALLGMRQLPVGKVVGPLIQILAATLRR